MENNFNTPVQVVENNMKGGVAKTQLGLVKMILLGMLAGMFIALGAAASNLAVHNMTNVGLARTVAGVIFPVGLIMIVTIGGELFTGNCMLIMPVLSKQAKITGMLKNLIVVYFSNMLGSVLTAYFIFMSAQFDYSDGGLGAYTIKVAMGKAGIDFTSAIFSGIMCNILVCIGVLLAGVARDAIGKIFGAFFPIFAFVICGFEHCVANMYYIPAGIMAASNDKYVDKACELYGYTANQITDQLTIANFFGINLLPVTIGNIIGGSVIIGGGLYLIYKSNFLNKEQ